MIHASHFMLCKAMGLAIKCLMVLVLAAALNQALAADYSLIPYSMIYNVDRSLDEYTAYLVNSKTSTIAKCRTIYKLTDNTLTSENCSALSSFPFSPALDNASIILSTIVFVRAANHQKDAVFGPDGIWRLDQSNGKVEFCVFGDIKAQCVVLNPD